MVHVYTGTDTSWTLERTLNDPKCSLLRDCEIYTFYCYWCIYFDERCEAWRKTLTG